jgi:hypothetical protein
MDAVPLERLPSAIESLLGLALLLVIPTSPLGMLVAFCEEATATCRLILVPYATVVGPAADSNTVVGRNVAAEEFHPVTRLVTFTEPRPVARSKPLAAL